MIATLAYQAALLLALWIAVSASKTVRHWVADLVRRVLNWLEP